MWNVVIGNYFIKKSPLLQSSIHAFYYLSYLSDKLTCVGIFRRVLLRAFLQINRHLVVDLVLQHQHLTISTQRL